MTTHLIAVDADTFQELVNEVRRLSQKIEGATIQSPPEWCNAEEAGRRLGVTPGTIRRKAGTGEIEARGSGKTRQFHVPL